MVNKILFTFFFISIFTSCSSQNSNSDKHILNEFSNDTIYYPSNWKLLEQEFMNNESGFVARFVDYSTKSQYAIKNKIDNSDEEIFEKYYSSKVDSMILAINSENRIIESSESMYRGRLYNKREYLMNYGLQGWYKQVSYYQLDSGLFRSVQLIYKIDGPKDLKKSIPTNLSKLDNQFRIK